MGTVLAQSAATISRRKREAIRWSDESAFGKVAIECPHPPSPAFARRASAGFGGISLPDRGALMIRLFAGAIAILVVTFLAPGSAQQPPPRPVRSEEHT